MNTRRKFIRTSLALAASGTIGIGSAFGESLKTLPSLKDRNILFTFGGWDGHQPTEWKDYLTNWLKEQGAKVTTSATLDIYANKSFMKEIDLVIQIHTMSEIKEEEENGLLNAIKNGAGMAGWHGGMCDAFRQNTAYQYMTGGQWVAHPGGIIDYDVRITKVKDEVTAGLSNFKMKSEQYYMHVDPNVKVLATTQFNGAIDSWIDGAVIPVTWKKTFGQGRVFYTSLGHNLSHVTEVPEALEMLKRGIQWASASKYEPTEKWMSPVYA